MNTPVEFTPGCIFGQNVIACGPGGVQIRDRRHCESCGTVERCVENVPNSQYWGPDHFYECGAWFQDYDCECNPDGKESRRGEFEARWEKALPEGTELIVNQEDAWLTGVRLPDGTEVLR